MRFAAPSNSPATIRRARTRSTRAIDGKGFLLPHLFLASCVGARRPFQSYGPMARRLPWRSVGQLWCFDGCAPVP